ncbi:MAG: alpha-1,2-fucosyltransferase [Ruminococcus flavefaciens]|nr:alpha-1,2-fucosyltransferase [Roseburia sp.]MCM1231444.1 alpha-1,2-fucosyltransferase [Ruminococcus flavefaciens]
MIVVKISDGLGNQIFQYAYARWLQTQTWQKIYLDVSDINRMADSSSDVKKRIELCDKRKYQLNNLRITLPVIDQKIKSEIFQKESKANKFWNYCRKLRLLPVVYMNETMCNEAGFRFSWWQNYYVEGCFFDKKYYEKAFGLLNFELRLKEKIAISEELQSILLNRNTVSLHVRRGDFLKYERAVRDISESDYYMKAMDYIKDKISNPFLLIFSDDIEWVRENMCFELEHRMISGQGYSDCEELILMSMCKNNIIANSTFSYWGAWLNPNREKIVVSPRGWKMKIIPDTWVQL